MTMKSRISAAIPNTAALMSSLRVRAGSAGRGLAGLRPSATSDPERLAPLLDHLRDALVQTVRLVPVVLHLLDGDPRRRRDVGAQRVIEGLRHRLRVLARVEDAPAEPR